MCLCRKLCSKTQWWRRRLKRKSNALCDFFLASKLEKSIFTNCGGQHAYSHSQHSLSHAHTYSDQQRKRGRRKMIRNDNRQARIQSSCKHTRSHPTRAFPNWRRRRRRDGLQREKLNTFTHFDVFGDCVSARYNIWNWGKQPLARPPSHTPIYYTLHNANDEDSCVE